MRAFLKWLDHLVDEFFRGLGIGFAVAVSIYLLLLLTGRLRF